MTCKGWRWYLERVLVNIKECSTQLQMSTVSLRHNCHRDIVTLAAGCHEIGVKTVTAALRKHRAAGQRSAHAQIFSSFDRVQCVVLLETGEEHRWRPGN